MFKDILNSAYCLKTDAGGNQFCRFKYPFDLQQKTFIKYNEISRKNSIEVRPEIIARRNDSRLNRHQQTQLQGWRANCDIQLVIDHHACIEYLAKYAAKSEKMTSVARDAFVNVVGKLSDSSSPKAAVRKLMMKCVGERDMGIQEVMHHIMSLKLFRSSFKVITLSLENSRKCALTPTDICLEQSDLEIYAKRSTYAQNLQLTNFIDFFSKFEMKGNKISLRKEAVIVRTIPSFSSNPEGCNYDQYCKFQLLKYRPWQNNPSNAWDNEEVSEDLFVCKWQAFLQSDKGKKAVPNWQRLLNEASKYIDSDHYFEDAELIDEASGEDWMYLARMVAPVNNAEDCNVVSLDYLNQLRSPYSISLINSMPFWLQSKKSKDDSNLLNVTPIIDTTLFNEKQQLAYNIVANHFHNNINDPLFLMITGQGGSGKSFVINALRNLLNTNCIVTSYFGIAAFNISGVTLHSLLSLPIRGKNKSDLRGKPLASLQNKLASTKYIIIDEFSVIGQTMLGWIDRRLRQASGLMNETFGGFSLILVGDTAQLPPVMDKPLYHAAPADTMSLMGYCAYQKIYNVVKLIENRRVTSEDQHQFRQLLIRLRDGKSTLADWSLLCSRVISNFNESYLKDFSVRLAYSNEQVADYNYKMLKSTHEPIFGIKASHNCKKAEKLSSEEFGGLESYLYLNVGSRVMLTRNIWVDKGLCNGSMGIVHSIIYKEGQNPPNLPIAVLVNFESYHGPGFDNEDKVVSIVPIISMSNSTDNMERQQLPLKLCWAITIHKSQGLTLNKAIVDLGPKEKVAGLAYVAISRVRKLSDLIIIPTTHERLTSVQNSANFKFRLEEEKRLDGICLKTEERYQSL